MFAVAVVAAVVAVVVVVVASSRSQVSMRLLPAVLFCALSFYFNFSQAFAFALAFADDVVVAAWFDQSFASFILLLLLLFS